MKLKKAFIISIRFLLMLNSYVFFTAHAQSTILYVGGTGSGNYSSITSAIMNANKNDIIKIYEGIYEENINVNKAVTIESVQNNHVTLKGTGITNVITIRTEDVRIHNITIMKSGKQVLSGD
jgi:pectin methylesterase-like acyl-CoA thioesterase